MLHAYTDLIVRVVHVPVDDVMVAFIETPFENVMEAGVRLPAPGEEKAWLERFGGQTTRAAE
jgi:phenylpyruvate tautomerase PptA (4-oxalocrotonate tautomerase family)